MYKVMAQLKSQERLPELELKRLQFQKLKKLLIHADKWSSFYRKRFADAGVNPSEMTALEELHLVPPLTKNELFNNHSELITNRPLGKSRECSTSGSTGIAMKFKQDSVHTTHGFAAVWRGRSWWDVNRNMRQANLWGRPVEATVKSNLETYLKYRLRNILHVNTFEDYDEKSLSAIVRKLKQFSPDLIYGYGSSLGRLARYMADQNIYLSDSERPRIVEYTADHMQDFEIELMKRHCGAPVLSQYGASEVPGLSQQCPSGNSHISVDNAVVEFLRPDGSAAAEGELADIVVTPLHEYAMPLIRYKVEDMGAYINGQCKCGVTLPLMELKVGKAVDLISTSTHTGVSAHILDYINIHLMRNELSGVRQFLVQQFGLDDFALTVAKAEKFNPASVETFVSKMREYLGYQIRVSISFVNEIPILASGKRRYYINNQSTTATSEPGSN